jgi:hypothetical protein
MFATSMPSSVAEADAKDLKSSIGRIRFLIERWSRSTKLLRYLILAISIGFRQPKDFSMQYAALIPAVLAPLRSITIVRGRPFTSKALAKNLVAAVLLRRFDGMKSRVLRKRSRPQRTAPRRGSAPLSVRESEGGLGRGPPSCRGAKSPQRWSTGGSSA